MRRAVVIRGAIAIVLIAFCSRTSTAQEPAAPSMAASPAAAAVPAGQKFILQLETPLHTRTTHKGDKVEFRTAADVFVDSQILIPNRSIVRATVTKSKRAGMLYGRAEIKLRFDQVELPDKTLLPLKATITRVGFDPVEAKKGEDPKLKGDSGSGGDVKDVASAGAQGAIIGILTAGPKGAMYGAGVSAAAVLISAALRRGPDIDLPRSTMFEASLDGKLEIPAASVAAQNAPISKPAPEERVAEADPEELQLKTRPELKRVRVENAGADPATIEPEPDSRPSIADAVTPSKVNGEVRTAEPASGGLTVSVKVQMVQVDAMVRDRSGRTIDNLKMSDFRVYEDGVLQEIANFSRDELPLAVALVVDRSESVAPYISELRRIAARALDQLKPQDEICLFSFAGDVEQMEELTKDRRRIADALDRIRAGGNTDITDALYEAGKYLSRVAMDRRHAVILISDNQQTAHPRVGERETITTMLETDTVLYSLKTSGVPSRISMTIPSLILGDPVSKIAKETGGEVFGVSGVYSLSGALGTVISRLRTRYSMSYYPSSAGQTGTFHEISVRLDEKMGKPGSDYFVHAKRGYYAVSPANLNAQPPRNQFAPARTQ